MRLISRHILRSLAAPFFWGVAALTGLLLLNALPPLIDLFGGKGLSPAVMVEGVLDFLPSLLVLTLPMAVLVSTLYAYSQLAAALEMVAMYANGISVWRMARPALVGAAVVAVLNFFLADQLTPKSNHRLTDLKIAVARKSPTLALRQQVLNTLPFRSGYVIRADAIEPVTGAMRNVTIFNLSEYEARQLVQADSGMMAESANGKDLVLTLFSGQIYEFTRDEPGRLQQTDFLVNRVVIRDVQNSLEKTTGRGGSSEFEMTSCEMLDQLDGQRWSAGTLRSQDEELTRRDLRALANLPPVMQSAAQVPPKFPPHCGRYRRFENWFRHLMLPQRLEAQTPAGQQPAAQQPTTPPQQPAVARPGPVIVQQPTPAVQTPPPGFLVTPPTAQDNGLVSPLIVVRTASAQVAEMKTSVLRYEVQYHQTFAIPLSSFCFVLIGMALALKYPNSGIGLVIGGSLIIFLGFYILLQAGKGIARSGAISPTVAMYAPLAIFTLIGLVAVHSANREMGTTRSSSILGGIVDFFHRLKG